MASGQRKNSSNSSRKRTAQKNNSMKNEVIIIASLGLFLLLFLCNFGLIGPVGNAISKVLFGIFGFLAYVLPVFLFFSIAFFISNKNNHKAMIKMTAFIIAFISVGILLELLTGNLQGMNQLDVSVFYNYSSENKKGGGVLFGLLAYGLFSLVNLVGSIVILGILILISIIIISEKSIVKKVNDNSRKVYHTAKETARNYNDHSREKRKEREQRRQEESIARQGEENGRETEKIRRMNKKVSGVMLDTTLREEPAFHESDDIHEITLKDLKNRPDEIYEHSPLDELEQLEQIQIHTAASADGLEIPQNMQKEEPAVQKETVISRQKPVAKLPEKEETVPCRHKTGKKYVFPPVSLLKKPDHGNSGSSRAQLKETAYHLQQTLKTFGVNVTITDISEGPSVTRYELQPEPGVKVSKIVNLADDIKLNLAASDIRIEAPIPGKSAVGIEVPNKENSTVALRELIESREFRNFPSKITFAVGKDISGQVIVSDIAKMPHMLIAGSTGSGKSVCINTIIMSILYKAHPDDVKLIMVDPKVVELSVYNGIPHLMIPVVTDPKKAAAALNWAVSEMSERYKKFADMNVRDLKGYNREIENMKSSGKEDVPEKMPQIVIIVDELADLMMVAAHEVEESICRLAQLARAAGIHLIIATQRPSVDVITGLIKANMPSRVAFAVSSGVDSRTILDMNGAEKLLGKGDMLYYPQGFPQPVRIQGAFVSDSEVSSVVDFIKNHCTGDGYNKEIEEQIKNLHSAGGSAGSPPDEKDEYFIQAGKYIIDKEKASIGMLQRVFKIGFNRAARIMDQLADCGVVGEEEGTKPRKILMSMEQFEEYIDEYL